ncbi:MAG TPA: trigger factor [Candidatus Omnitrophota bacterium]|nr:trigger factor [Candidatus Omnitrophota bacterium]HRZ15609.1 trigger factor [Candidatus Omnitrophota bacterium]
MKTAVKKIDAVKREMTVEVTGDVVKTKFEEVFKKIGQEARVKGFRPGHAPRDILEKNFSSVAHEQVLRELIPHVYQQALEQEKLDAVDMPEISEVKLERDALVFKAVVEVHPEITVPGYKGIKLEYKPVQIGADEVKRSLDSVKESRKIEKMDDVFAQTLGYPTLVELEKTVERQLAVQKDNGQRQQLENTIIEHILKGQDFKLPQALVSKQLEDMLRQAKVDLALRGVPKDKIEAEEKNLAKEMEPQAQKQVRIYLILASIARKENITVDEHMPRAVMEFLFRSAQWVIKEA